MHDPISDLLTRIRNAGHAKLPTVRIPHSKLKEAIVRLLVQEGYIESINVTGGVKRDLTVTLKFQNKKSILTHIRQISRPGLRRYVNSKSIPRVLGGLGVAILSTPKGVLTGVQAKRENQGGELLCYVW